MVLIENNLNYRKIRKKFHGSGFLWTKRTNNRNKIYTTFNFSYITSHWGKFYLKTRIHSSHRSLQVTAGSAEFCSLAVIRGLHVVLNALHEICANFMFTAFKEVAGKNTLLFPR